MSVAFTIAGLQAELSAVADAATSHDYSLARDYVVRARAVLAGLPIEAQSDGQVVKFRQDLADLSDSIDAAQAAVTGGAVAGSDRRRLIRTRLSPGSPRGGSCCG